MFQIGDAMQHVMVRGECSKCGGELVCLNAFRDDLTCEGCGNGQTPIATHPKVRPMQVGDHLNLLGEKFDEQTGEVVRTQRECQVESEWKSNHTFGVIVRFATGPKRIVNKYANYELIQGDPQ